MAENGTQPIRDSDVVLAALRTKAATGGVNLEGYPKLTAVLCVHKEKKLAKR